MHPTVDQQYSVSFYAKADTSGRQLMASISQSYSPFGQYFTKQFTLSTTWQQYTFTFTQPVNDSVALVLASGAQNGKVSLDAISFTAGASTPSPSPTPTPSPALSPSKVPAPTGGLITNFTSERYNRFQIDGVPYGVLTVNKSYNLEQIDNHTLRFEIQQGDSVWCCNNETSEIQRQQKWDPGTPLTIAYQFMLEPGAANNGDLMTVINVSDAVLLGLAKGPTFTGQVDGLKFSGSITYADPLPVNTKGKITNFKKNNAEVWQIDGKNVGNQNASKAWSLTQLDDYAVRLEVRAGDLWVNPHYNDAGNNRNEVAYGDLNGATIYPEGVQLNLSMTVTIEPGPVSTSGWCDLAQLHSTTNTPPSPFYINLDKGDFLNVIIQSPTIPYKSIYRSPQPVVRGKAMNLRAEVMMKPAGGGYARVWLDNVQIANYTGAIGATGSQYGWKFGLYRGEVPETLSAVFRNVSLTGP